MTRMRRVYLIDRPIRKCDHDSPACRGHVWLQERYVSASYGYDEVLDTLCEYHGGGR